MQPKPLEGAGEQKPIKLKKKDRGAEQGYSQHRLFIASQCIGPANVANGPPCCSAAAQLVPVCSTMQKNVFQISRIALESINCTYVTA